MSWSGTSPGPLHPPLRRRHLPIVIPPFRLCDASDRTPCTRWSARPAAGDCSSASIRSFAVMCGFTKFRQGHRRSPRRGEMRHAPGGCTGSRAAERRRKIGTRSRRRGASHSWPLRRRPIGVGHVVRSRVWRPSSMPQPTTTRTHSSVSPRCGGERTDSLCSSISRGPHRSRRTPIRLSLLSRCLRLSPLAHLLPPPSQPRRCRPQDS